MPEARPYRAKKRSPREWALRGGIAGIVLALGYVSTTQTLAFAIGKSNAERAHALSPGDGRIAGELAEQLSVAQVSEARGDRANRLARQALDDEPLAVPALTALILDAGLRGDNGAARRLSVHSNALSRRELGTQLWLIEDAVTRGQVSGALRHYDVALRTSQSAPDLLFPVLSNAIADPAIAKALARTLAGRPPWGEAFIAHLGAAATPPAVRADFLGRLANAGLPVDGNAQASAVNSLFAAGAFNEAWDYYGSLRRGVNPRRARDPNFTAGLHNPSIFDWTPVNNDAGVSASIQSTRDGGILDYAVPSTVGGVVLQQAQLLPSGRYRLEGISAGIDQRPETRPYWQLSCIDGRELGRVELPEPTGSNGRFIGEFTVGGDCPAQTLNLVARPSPAIGGSTGQIKRAALVPVGQVQ